MQHLQTFTTYFKHESNIVRTTTLIKTNKNSKHAKGLIWVVKQSISDSQHTCNGFRHSVLFSLCEKLNNPIELSTIKRFKSVFCAPRYWFILQASNIILPNGVFLTKTRGCPFCGTECRTPLDNVFSVGHFRFALFWHSFFLMNNIGIDLIEQCVCPKVLKVLDKTETWLK